MPQVDDVPLPLRNLFSDDISVLRLFDIHCGTYHRVVHGYRQRTGPFRLTWSALRVEEKIATVGDVPRRRKLKNIFNFLMTKRNSAYAKLVIVQSRGMRQLFSYKSSVLQSTRASSAPCGPPCIIAQPSARA